MKEPIEQYIFCRTSPVWDLKSLMWSNINRFGFRNKYLTIYQVNCIIDIIEVASKEKSIYGDVFLNMAQAFDKICHQGPKYRRIRVCHGKWVYYLFKSYIAERQYRAKCGEEYAELKNTSAAVFQVSELGLVDYILSPSAYPKVKG